MGLTDFEKIVVYLGVVGAVFLAAMAAGQWSLWLLAAGVGLLVVVVLGAYAIQLRRLTAGSELATAQVLAVSTVPPNVGVAASCSMRLAVFLAARGRVETKHRVTALALDRWPTRGQTFPVEVFGSNPRRLRIRWDLVDEGMVRAPDRDRPKSTPDAPPPAPQPRKPPTYTSATYTSAYAGAAAATGEAASSPAPQLFEEFTDLDDETVRTRPPDDLDRAGGDGRLPLPMPVDLPDAPTNGHDPDGLDLADFDEPRLEQVMLPEFDPAEIDRRDFLDFGPDVADEGPTVTGPTAPTPTIPSPRDPAAPAHSGVELALPVADLSRSLHFYRHALGMRVVYTSGGSAVVEAEGTRILLDSEGTAAGAGETVHLEVTDIEATCARLRARGIEIRVPPTATGGGTAQLWRAWLRDPDGHDVELVEWRRQP